MTQSSLQSLYLTDFRNFDSAHFSFPQKITIICGPNGTGKTNILEAISLLAPGRGLRRLSYGDMVRQGAMRWTVSAKIEDDLGETQIGTQYDRSEGTQKRHVKINGEKQRSPNILSEFTTILSLTPDMDSIFRGPESEKRAFFDTLVTALHPAHMSHTNAYDTLVRQRNKLFENPRPDYLWIEKIESQIAAKAVAISFARAETKDVLNEAMSRTVVGPFPKASFSLAGQWEEELANHGGALSAEQAEQLMREGLERSRTEDHRTGRTSFGPHRTEIQIIHVDNALPAKLCSTGEQKALLVSTLLTHADLTHALTGRAPWLLLDEITSHFDANRRAFILNHLEQRGAPAFLTGTDKEQFKQIWDAASIIQTDDTASLNKTV